MASLHDRDGRFSSSAPLEKGRGMTCSRTLQLPALVLLVAVLAAAVMLVGVLGIPSTKADAAPRGPVKRPPAAVLMKGEKELQKGRLGSYCWPQSEVSVVCSDTPREFNDPRTTPHVGAPSTLHIRIHLAARPEGVELRWGHRVKERGGIDIIVNKSRPRATYLRRVQKEGETVAWDVFFRVKRPDKHYYLSFSSFWEGNDNDGDAYWSFHMKTRRAS